MTSLTLDIPVVGALPAAEEAMRGCNVSATGTLIRIGHLTDAAAWIFGLYQAGRTFATGKVSRKLPLDDLPEPRDSACWPGFVRTLPTISSPPRSPTAPAPAASQGVPLSRRMHRWLKWPSRKEPAAMRVTATQAKNRFGSLCAQARRGPVFVEQAGQIDTV